MRLEELINKYKNNLNPTDLAIWKYIYNHKMACRRLSIHDLAAACSVSSTTIVRFSQKLSLDGFTDLKAILKMETTPNPEQDMDVVKSVVDLYQRVAREMIKKDFEDANVLLYGAKRIFAYGSGCVQKNVISEMKRLFLYGSVLIYELGGADEIKFILNTLTKDDVVIIVSLSGESSQVVKMAQTLQLKEVPVISITRLKDNTLAGLSLENIYITTSLFSLYINPDDPAYESVLTYFLVIELWFVKYQLYKKQRLQVEKNTEK